MRIAVGAAALLLGIPFWSPPSFAALMDDSDGCRAGYNRAADILETQGDTIIRHKHCVRVPATEAKAGYCKYKAVLKDESQSMRNLSLGFTAAVSHFNEYAEMSEEGKKEATRTVIEAGTTLFFGAAKRLAMSAPPKMQTEYVNAVVSASKYGDTNAGIYAAQSANYAADLGRMLTASEGIEKATSAIETLAFMQSDITKLQNESICHTDDKRNAESKNPLCKTQDAAVRDIYYLPQDQNLGREALRGARAFGSLLMHNPELVEHDLKAVLSAPKLVHAIDVVKGKWPVIEAGFLGWHDVKLYYQLARLGGLKRALMPNSVVDYMVKTGRWEEGGLLNKLNEQTAQDEKKFFALKAQIEATVANLNKAKAAWVAAGQSGKPDCSVP